MCVSEWNGDIKKTNQQTYSHSIWREEKRPNVRKFEREKNNKTEIEGEGE